MYIFRVLPGRLYSRCYPKHRDKKHDNVLEGVHPFIHQSCNPKACDENKETTSEFLLVLADFLVR